MSSHLLSLGAWYFLPNLVTGWIQTIYYRITLRAGDPAPQPGTPQYIKHRKIIHCSVIGAYLLYCIYEADWNLRQESTYYQHLGVEIDVGEKTLQKTLRKISAQLHPDRYPEHQKDKAHDAFIRVKAEADALINPAKRFAYDRFGPDSTDWKHCKSIGDYVWQGAQNSGLLYFGTLISMVIAHILGMMPFGRYWRFLAIATLVVFEAYMITRPTPDFLTSHINQFLRATHLHASYLPFQIIKIARQTFFSAFIAMNQLGPILASSAAEADSPQGLQNATNQIRGIVHATKENSQRLLQLECMPFKGQEGEKGMERLKRELSSWLVNNDIQKQPGVQAAMQRVMEKRIEQMSEGNMEGLRERNTS
ncbi:hypothetical protein Vi05172_g10434 [Venturia inaequalis]|uniref:J domain-containing protein n=1 Tax=Venturia inaequalis TaxID=5025 RepID=A0A8H3VS07_VENIN|nr:hypothetical protein EG327_008772 [Venturia inaequalis]RDI79592.1 hypothetical protein Vi05172_g10434 [Venturia inaequalis]